MDQDNSTIIGSNIISLGGKSWTAYIPLAIWSIIFLPFALLFGFGVTVAAGVFVSLSAIALVAYKVLLLRSYHLYYDDTGVWIYSGILPWKKGTTGVKWRDLDEAVMFQTIWSWMFKSYTIRVGHRFTKSSEMLLTHMAGGHQSVMQINSLHIEKVRMNALN